MTMSNVIPEKPNLSLYFGQTVKKVSQSQSTPWHWVLTFSNDVEVQNYSPDETYAPKEFVGWKFISVSFSVHDTTLHFQDPQTKIIRKWSLKPTSYTVHDPKHGGEVIPQWPEEMEEKGLAPEDIGKVSDPPSEEWSKEYSKLTSEADRRAQTNAQEFLEEEDGA